ncbi:MAG: hypothetical protein AB8G18_11755 [Gammaproteobacteria bacterium]
MKSNRQVFLSAASLAIALHAHSLELQCEQDIKDAPTARIPVENYERYELTDALQCRWINSNEEPTASILFYAPNPKEITEIEVATRLDVNNSTATHVALLDRHFKAVKWVPFSAFRERKGYLTARFFLNPSDAVRYILVGGAQNASEQTLKRIYSPATSDLLNVAGLVTAREVNTEFTFAPVGKIRVRTRKPQNKRIKVTR